MSFLEIEKRSQETSLNMTEFQSHNFFELYFLLAGKREVFVENKLFHLKAGAMCVIPPYAIHKTEGGAYMRTNIYISDDFLNDLEKKQLSRLSEQLAFALSDEQFTFVSQILKEAATDRIGDAAVRRNYLHSFIKALIAYLGVQELSPIAPQGISPTNMPNDTTVLKIVAYINENYQASITLEGISKRFFISKNTLCKRFRSVMNISLIQYVIYVRLNKAKMYLTTTSKSMEEVAELSGFPSANYFSLIFKKSFGISPMEYRKKH